MNYQLNIGVIEEKFFEENRCKHCPNAVLYR